MADRGTARDPGAVAEARGGAMIDLKPVLLAVGILLSTLGVAMLLPILFDLVAGNPDWTVFAASSGFTVFIGVTLTVMNWGHTPGLSVRGAFLLTTLSWVAVSAFAAIPMWLSEIGISYTDAFFESMSGLTTTGSTVLSGLDTMPPGILMWRSLLQWLGGLGIIVIAIAILPMLRVGGMLLFRIERFDVTDKMLPSVAQITQGTAYVYFAISIACVVAYRLAGMSDFDALIHAMTTVATGGYSSHDASFGYFDSDAIKIVSIIFMLSGSIPFGLYLLMVSGRYTVIWRDSQVRWLLATCLAAAALAWLAALHQAPGDGSATFINALFNTVSVITTTGYATADYNLWGSAAVGVFFIATFLGGCAGSTAGGIKIFRFQVLFQGLRQKMRLMYHPHGVFLETYNGRPLSPEAISAVTTFFFLYIGGFAATALALGLMGLDTMTALSGAATALSNVGPGLGETIGPAGNFAPLPDAAKWVLSAAMLLGRLELFAVLVLFLPAFWRS